MKKFKDYLFEKNWIQDATNPEHKGYCTPMSKKTCTPHRKALARRFKSGDIHDSKIEEDHIAIAMGKMLDDEGSMVLSQLDVMERSIKMVRNYIGKDYNKQLPSWVQSKITLAADYIDTAGNYLSNKNE